MIRPAFPGSTTLPLACLVAASFAFVLGALALPWLTTELAGHYYHPRLLALTHTITLGWITLTIMGASYQLLPIVLERPVWSERLAWWQLAAFVAGVVGIVGHFAIGQWTGFVWSAAFLLLAVGAHVVNAGLSIARARPSFTARMMAIALAGLALTALFGAALGAHKVWPFLPVELFPLLHAHVHLALLGWVLPMVLGVGARVYPMFLLAPEPADGGAERQLLGVVVGVPLVAGGLVLERPGIVVVGTALVAAAVAAHLLWLRAMVRAAKRPRLDWGLRFVIAGAAFLMGAAALGIAIALDLARGPHLALAYGILALGGWASLTIVGMLLKIVPFLVWFRVYGPRVGRGPLPTLPELSWPRAEGAAFALLTTGTAALAGAVAVGEPSILPYATLAVALGALAFAASLARVLRHLGRSRTDQAVSMPEMRAAS
jgi:hypothetical protein